jgi:hypothetical protein
VLLFAPLGTQVETVSLSGSFRRPEPTVTHPSLLRIQGWSVALPLSIPVALAGAGVVAAVRRARRSMIVIAALLGAFVMLGALSVGIFYLPAEASVIISATTKRR